MNTINVHMFDDKGNNWSEDQYEGYGDFGGKDYYELLSEMNGGESCRDEGITLAFSEKDGIKFPALVENLPFDFETHDFTYGPETDPNQSWYSGDDEDDY
jgi:hypothetical protein